MVVNAAFEIARNSGMERVAVKNIADRIGCSVQPIYSYCKNMEGLRQDVTDQAGRFIQEYIAAHTDRGLVPQHWKSIYPAGERGAESV